MSKYLKLFPDTSILVMVLVLHLVKVGNLPEFVPPMD